MNQLYMYFHFLFSDSFRFNMFKILKYGTCTSKFGQNLVFWQRNVFQGIETDRQTAVTLIMFSRKCNVISVGTAQVSKHQKVLLNKQRQRNTYTYIMLCMTVFINEKFVTIFIRTIKKLNFYTKVRIERPGIDTIKFKIQTQ